MKGVEPLIAAIFIIIISITGIAIVLESSQPSVSRLQEISLLEEAKKILTQIDNAVRAVGEEGEGSARVLQLSVSDGKYLIDTGKDAIEFSMDSRSQVVGIDVIQTDGNVNIYGKPNQVLMNLSYSTINITGGGSFGRGIHSLIIRNDGYDIANQKQVISISLVSQVILPVAFINQYNQFGDPYIAKGGTPSGYSSYLNFLGEGLTYNIPEEFEVAGGTFFYSQSQTKNITGYNTTPAYYTNSLDNQNYNVTAKLTSIVKEGQYNQSETSIIKGTYFSGDTSNLNVLGDDLFYDVQGDLESSYTQNETVFYDDFETWLTNADCRFGSGWSICLDTTDSFIRGSTTRVNGSRALTTYDWDSDDFPTTEALIECADLTQYSKAYLTFWWRKNALDAGEYGRIDINTSSSGWINIWDSGTGSTSSFAERQIDITNYISSHTCIGIHQRSNGGSTEYVNYDDFRILGERTVNNYKVEVWHNSSVIGYSGSLNSINISLNFTATQAKSFFLQIYNWSSSSWVSTNCNSGLVNANAWNMWWCNETVNPTNYISSNGIARIRISSETNEVRGILREDYVQYFILSTEPPKYNIAVEHNSSVISQKASSISVINVTSLLKTNISTSSFRLFVYNFTGSNWYLCQQSNIGSNYLLVQCIITDPSNFVSQESDGIVYVRLESNSSNPYQIMEDYLVYKIISDSKYRVEVWHNSSQIADGNISFINVTINFTTNVSDDYSLQIYDWLNSQWYSNNCDSGSVTADAPTMWWCNETSNPINYNSSDRRVRIRINSTAGADTGLLIEDYVQYFVGYAQ